MTKTVISVAVRKWKTLFNASKIRSRIFEDKSSKAEPILLKIPVLYRIIPVSNTIFPFFSGFKHTVNSKVIRILVERLLESFQFFFTFCFVHTLVFKNIFLIYSFWNFFSFLHLFENLLTSWLFSLFEYYYWSFNCLFSFFFCIEQPQ